MSITAGTVYDGVRALLNDNNNVLFTDSVIAPYFTIAMETLRTRCEENQIPFGLFTTATPITVTAGVTNIGGSGGPALPTDLIEVLECWEIPAGTSADYMQMRHVRFLPKTSIQTAYLEVWSWQDQIIKLLGATGDIQVKLDYIADNYPATTTSGTVIRVTNCVNFLKMQTAGLVSFFVGANEDRATVLYGLANDAIETMLNIKIMSQQNMSTRRRPFMANYKNRAGSQGR